MTYEFTNYYKLYQEYLELEDKLRNESSDQIIINRLNVLHKILMREAPHFLVENYIE